MIRFNQLFRGWTLGAIDCTGEKRDRCDYPKAGCELESAFVFDVNVYANDYLRGLGLRFLRDYAPDPDFWPLDREKRKKAEGLQDSYALVKMRRFMSDAEWGRFALQLRTRVRSSLSQAVDERLKAAQDIWTRLSKNTSRPRKGRSPTQHAGGEHAHPGGE